VKVARHKESTVKKVWSNKSRDRALLKCCGFEVILLEKGFFTTV
jgi:hypothetical protein